MTSAVTNAPAAGGAAVAQTAVRGGLLADRLIQGARALAEFAATLSDAEWRTPISDTDRRAVGTVVHHVASVYPVEIDLALRIARGGAVTGVTGRDIDTMNGNHAAANPEVPQLETIELLRRNAAAAEAAIRALSDEELDRAATVSLYDAAPLTCQFVLEDHAVRHSYHHLALIRAVVGR
jgi:hypothetical protein